MPGWKEILIFVVIKHAGKVRKSGKKKRKDHQNR